MQYVYFVLLQPNMFVGGRRCADEYLKAARTEVWRSENCCETAAVFVIVILSISCYYTAYWVIYVIMHILLVLAVVSSFRWIGR